MNGIRPGEASLPGYLLPSIQTVHFYPTKGQLHNFTVRQKMKHLILILISTLFISFAYGVETPQPRPKKWAAPVELAGAPNLHQVSKDLYRSAQPTSAGMRNLKNKGVKTIVNLRSFHSDRKKIAGLGLGYEHIYMKAWHPEREDVVQFLKIVTDPKKTPILLHCQHGADRTGIMCAIYRITAQGWTKKDAILEMTEGKYGFHEIWENLPKWLEELDIKSLKKDAGIK